MKELVKEICEEVASSRDNVPNDYPEILMKLCESITELEFQHKVSKTQIVTLMSELLKESSESVAQFRDDQQQ